MLKKYDLKKYIKHIFYDQVDVKNTMKEMFMEYMKKIFIIGPIMEWSWKIHNGIFPDFL